MIKVLRVCFSAVIAAAAILVSQQTYADDNIDGTSSGNSVHQTNPDVDETWYVGTGLGQGERKDYCTGVNSPYTCSQTGTAQKIFIGLQSNRYFSVEFGYMTLPKATLNGSGTWTGYQCTPFCTPVSGTFSFADSVQGNALQFAGIGSVPLGKGLSLLGRLGLLRWTTTDTSVLTASMPPNTFLATFPLAGGHPIASYNSTDSGITAMVGMGLKVNIGEHFAVRGEYEQTASKIGSAVNGRYIYQIFSANLIYRF